MKLTIETPQGTVTATVSEGFIGNAEITPEGAVIFSLIPDGLPEPDAKDESPGFIGE